jgi:hypothetical protein
MEKVIYPAEEIKYDLFGRIKSFPAELTKDVLKSLDGIVAKVLDKEREVFLNNDFGYVWCFSHKTTFNSSLLSKIQKGDWKDLSFLASHPNVQNIITDLRTAYNSNPVKFLNLEYNNPFYDPCVIGDMVFSIDPQKYIKISLAVEGGDKMAHAFDEVLRKYDIKI